MFLARILDLCYNHNNKSLVKLNIYKKIMKIIVIRHGQTNYNVKDLCNGVPNKEVVLTPLGRKQARVAALNLAKEKIEAIYVSKLLRSAQTAKIINKYHKVKISFDERLNDRSMGEFEGKSASLFYAWRDKQKRPWTAIPKGGESYESLKKRAQLFIKDLAKKDYKTVLIVTHLPIIKVLRGYFKNLSNEVMDKLTEKQVPNCKIMVFKVSKKRPVKK